jgi:hypothetical protein
VKRLKYKKSQLTIDVTDKKVTLFFVQPWLWCICLLCLEKPKSGVPS